MQATQKIRQSHRDVVLMQARASLRKGRYPVPIPPRSKRPTLEKWPNLRLTEQQLQDYFGENDNIGWLCGEPNGNLADVDLDCDAAVSLAKKFLLPTDRTQSGAVQLALSHFRIRPVLRRGQHTTGLRLHSGET
jgi:hypothetical protein